MTNHSVVIAGGGPTELMLAGELALAGVDVAVVERRPNQELSGARALGISSRTIAKYAGRWELPVLGEVAAPAAVLIRPDGYVAWVGDRTSQGLTEALTTWFGTPAIP